MTKPDQQDMSQEQLEQCISTLTDVASEIRSENHAGWGNALDDVIESLKGRRLVQAVEDDDDSILCKCGIYITKGDEVCYNCEMLANAASTEALQPASPDKGVMVPRSEIERLINVLRYTTHPLPSPHADYLAGLLSPPSEQVKP